VTFGDYLSEAFVRNALIAASLVAISAGLIGPVVIMRDLAFAVHGTAELAFTGAAAGLVMGNDPLLGALLGSIVVATAIGFLGHGKRERNSAIGVILGFGLGVGVYLLSLYRGFATAATNILFGQIFGVSPGQIALLTAVAIGVLLIMALLYRPLLFASVDPDMAQARGVPTRLVGLLFVYVLAFTVTEAAQIVGTLLVLSLAITPAAAASRLSVRAPVVIATSVAFALVAADGGLLLSLVHSDIKASVLISAISFALYVLARLAARLLLPPERSIKRRSSPPRNSGGSATADSPPGASGDRRVSVVTNMSSGKGTDQ
jgi:zinc/manganese transport system permease protein